MTTFNNLLIEHKDRQCWITINRPTVLNALNRETIHEITQAVREMAAKSEVNTLVITGAGEKSFVAGADISEIRSLSKVSAHQFAQAGHDCMTAIENCGKPVIAAVNGYCLGGGMELALACDVIYASEKAVMGLPEVALGIFPGWGGTQRLPRLIGRNRAKELIYTGRKLTAAEAFSWGIVNKVFPAGELLGAVQALATEIGRQGPAAVALAKRAIDEGTFESLEKGLSIEREVWSDCFTTEDAKEGLAAFVEKRKPMFKGI